MQSESLCQPDTGTKSAVVMLTRRCNMSCAHCSVASHPGIKEEPTIEELRRKVMELGESGVKGIQFTGGEPLIRHKVLFELMELAHERYGITSAIVSNGFWGKKKERADEFFDRLLSLGLVRLTISYDRFHAKFMGPEPVVNILEAARRRFWPVNVNITRTKDDGELLDLIEPFRSHPNAALRFYDVQPVGQAESLEEELRGQIEGFCSGCEQFTLSDDGRALACNGPAYFEKDHSGLVLGRTSEKPLQEFLKDHAEDPILETIRLSGPAKLKRTLESMPEFKDFPFRESYSGMCQLCRQINSDPKAVKALRERLSEPAETALRIAQKQVKISAREGLWHREAVNANLARRAFFLTLSSNRVEYRREITQIVSRADVDWNLQAEMLRRNGLLSKILEFREYLEPHAPQFFWTLAERDDTSVRPLEDVEAALRLWRSGNYTNLLRLGLSVERSDEANIPDTRLGRLAKRLLHRHHLSHQRKSLPFPEKWAERLALQVATDVVAPQFYRHQNLFLKPALHVLTIERPGELPRQIHRAWSSFLGAWSRCREFRGSKKAWELLKKDLSKVFTGGSVSLGPEQCAPNSPRPCGFGAEKELKNEVSST